MSRIRFGLDLSIFSAVDTVSLGTEAERLGYDSAWVADHLIDLEACKVDPWVVLGGIASKTSHLLLGTAVTDVQRTHPAKLAQMTATLDELSGGRAVLGVGSGEIMNLKPFGLPWSKPSERIARLMEAIEVMRLLWSSSRENPANFLGKYYSLDGAWLDQKTASKPRPKVYVGALGSSTLLRKTGEIADGWLNYFNTSKLYKEKVYKIREGAIAAKRNPDEIDCVVYLGVAFTDDKTELNDSLQLMKILLASERNTLKRIGINVSVFDDDAYINCIPNKRILDAAVAASAGVPDEIAKQFMIYGTNVEEAIRVIDSFVEAGGRHFQLAMLTHNIGEMMKSFADCVMKEYRSKHN